MRLDIPHLPSSCHELLLKILARRYYYYEEVGHKCHTYVYWADIGYAASGSCIEEVNITSFAAHKIYIFYTDVHFIYMQGVSFSKKKSIQKSHFLKETHFILDATDLPLYT